MGKFKYLSKKLMILIFCAVLLCSIQSCAACTGVYVGSNATDDGSIIYARSNDYQETWGNHITVTPAVENESGRFMPVNKNGSVQTEIPATTYQYTSTPFMDSVMAKSPWAHDAAACTNEYGVAMSMSVTAYPNSAALEADPLIKTGITEFTANDLVICQSKTAREAVDVLLGLIDKYGSSESNIAVIANQSEAWYVEMYTGHQYAAVKLPNDKVSVFGNEYSLEYLSDYEDSIISKDLISLAEENAFAVYGKNHELNLFETYSGKQKTADYSHMRTWIGHKILAPSKFTGDYDHDAMYPLCFTPDRKVSLHDVCQLMRNRFEGTEYSPDETGRIDMRVIGTDTSLSVHVIQIFPNLPAEMSCISWVSSGPVIYGVFIPVSNNCINVSEAYGANQPADKKDEFDTDNYPYYVFKDITTRCVGPDNYKIYGNPVREYWYGAERNMFNGINEVLSKVALIEDKDIRANYITSYCNDMQSMAFNDGKQILSDIVWTQNKNSNTYKIDSSTGERKVIPPMEVQLNASKYGNVPDVPGSNNTTSSIKAKDIVKVFRNATQFSATFLDSEGNYLANGTVVTFNINGKSYNRTVDENALAKLNINLDPGKYIITSINTVTGEKLTNNVVVISRINENRDITKYYKNATQYTVKIIGDDGKAVGAGEVVTFNVNGVFYNRTTDENGIATLNINLSPGDYVITADYKGCRAANNIAVLPVLKAEDLKMKYMDGSQFKVDLVDGQGNPYAGQNITFNVNGVFYNRTTDANGQAELNIRLPSGEYIITSSYNGVNVANRITITG